MRIGTNSFMGSVLNTVGTRSYSDFINDLNNGEVVLVIDAFDEAEITTGRQSIANFIDEINQVLDEYKSPTAIMLARTETSQFIASYCAIREIPIIHFEIGFFSEDAAKSFISRRIIGNGKLTKADEDCINSYYDNVKKNITAAECYSFLGYAPVLEAISMHIKETANRQKMISDLSAQTDCSMIIMKIMNDLLEREQDEKLIPALKSRCESKCPEFTDWDKIYTAEEQLVRLVYYIIFGDIHYNNYTIDSLPPQIIDDYQDILNVTLPQHPFMRKSSHTSISRNLDFTGPAFRDFTLARLVLNEKHESLGEMYFDEIDKKMLSSITNLFRLLYGNEFEYD